MRNIRRVTIICLLFLLLTLTGSAVAQLRKLNIAYTATSPYQAALIIAQETGIFKKHGLEPSLILTPGGSLGFQAMMGGEKDGLPIGAFIAFAIGQQRHNAMSESCLRCRQGHAGADAQAMTEAAS